MSCLCANAQAPTARVWTNQQGRTVNATFVEAAGVNVVLQLENGTKTTVHLGTLSGADQDYLKKIQVAKPTAGGTTNPVSNSGALEWPKEVLSIDTKSIVVAEGQQDAASRRYHYHTGNFEFIATAPLANSVMAEVAADFLLTEKFFLSQCWNWTPKPKKGDRFTVYLAETPEDFIAMGGSDRDSADIIEDNSSLIRFSALGLKKVGARYQYDAKAKEPGRVTSIVAYGMLQDVSGWLHPWTLQGMSNFLKFVAYQNNGTVRLTELESPLKKAVKELMETNKVKLDLQRLLMYMHTDFKAVRGDVQQFKLEQQIDCFLLVYFFGFLDGDGTGQALHQYYRNIFARSKRARDPQKAESMLAEQGMDKASPEDILTKLLAGRDDGRLGAEMTEKFKKIGIRFN